MLSSRFAQLLQIIGANTRFGGSFPLPAKARRKPLRVRDPNDPVQAARIKAAQDKRQRKADKLAVYTLRSHLRQGSHNVWPTVLGENGSPVIHTSLHPLYVNRG